MFNYTKCDAIAIGRGAQGNPWIFKRIADVMNGEVDREPTVMEIVDLSLKHLDLVCSIKGERVGVREMRKHIAWYLKGLPNSNEVKNKINQIDNRDEIKKVLLEYIGLNN